MIFVALSAALPPIWPNYFYIVLRVVISASAFYLVFLYRAKLESHHCIFLVILAYIYSPIVPIRLDGWTWTAVSLASLIGLFWILLYLRRTFIQEGGDLDPSDVAGSEKVIQAALLSENDLAWAVILPFWVMSLYGISYFLFLKAPEMTRTEQATMISMEEDFKQPRKVEGIFKGLRSAESEKERLEAIFAVGATTVYLELPPASRVDLEADRPVELYEYRHSDTVGWQPVSRSKYYWARVGSWVSIAAVYLCGGFLFLYLLGSALYTLFWEEVASSIYLTIAGKMNWLPYYRR